MKIFQLLLLYFFTRFLAGLNIAVFPVTGFSKWKVIGPDEMECPGGLPPTAKHYESLVSFPAIIPHERGEILADGYVCYKYVLKSTCEESFLFTTSYKTHFERIYVSRQECEASIEGYSKGHSSIPYFPPYVCRWASVNEEISVKIHIAPLSIRYDPLDSSFVDKRFATGSCKYDVCPFKDGKTLWLRDKHETLDCRNGSNFTITAHLSTNTGSFTPTSGFFSSNVIGSGNISLACKMFYCGREGIRLNSGEWFSSGADAIKNTAALQEWYKKLKPCGENNKIREVSVEHLSELAVRSDTATALFLKCIEVKSKIMKGETINRIDLSFLTPDRPGRFMVYRVRDGRLEGCFANYEMVHMLKRLMVNGTLGFTFAGEPVTWSKWHMDPGIYLILTC